MSQMAVPPGGAGLTLPAIVSVEASRVRYDPPRRHYVGQQALEVREGIELLVRTAAALPIRALTPALFIGDAVVSDYEVAGKNLYRFFLFDFERITPGAPIAFG